MLLYRHLGYWYFEVKAIRLVSMETVTPMWPGGYPVTPYLMDDFLFQSYIRHTVRVAYFTFGQMWDQLAMWTAWAREEVNWVTQGRPIYRWQPLDRAAWWGYFENAEVRKLGLPTFGPETLWEAPFLSCLGVYREKVWLYKQGGTEANPENVFTEVGPLGNVLMWNSAAPNWLKGYPDRWVYAMKMHNVIQEIPVHISRVWTKGAAMFLGKGVKIDTGKYKVGGALGYKVDRVPPTDTWKMW